jgi:hypothetical protein
MVPAQLPAPVHDTLQSWPQVIGNWHALAPPQAMSHTGLGPQSMAPHAESPWHTTWQGPSPQLTPLKQVWSPRQSTTQLAAFPQRTELQAVRAVHCTTQARPGGQTTSALALVSMMVHPPAAHPPLQTAGHEPASTGALASMTAASLADMLASTADASPARASGAASCTGSRPPSSPASGAYPSRPHPACAIASAARAHLNA